MQSSFWTQYAYVFFYTRRYYTENGFYNDDDSLNADKITERLNYLDKLVTTFSFSKKLVAAIEEINTDLPILFL